MTDASLVINAVLENKDIPVLYSVDSLDELLSDYLDVWSTIRDYHITYGTVPDKKLIADKHPDFELQETPHDTRFYVDEMKANFVRARTGSILKAAAVAERSEGLTPFEMLEKLQFSLSKLNRFKSGVVDLDLSDVDNAEEYYEKRREQATANGGVPGISTGISFFDANYPSGMCPGDLVVVLGWAQPHSEPILTPTGWTTMGDLKIGDLVVGSDGEPTMVTETHERGTRKVVRVNFSDGTFVLCDKDHLWEVQTAKQRQNNSGTKTVSTEQMLNTDVLFDRPGRNSYKYYLPLPEPVVGEKIDCVVGPYLMGQLLSDGCTVGASVLLTTNDEESIARARNENPHLSIQERTQPTSTARQWIVRGGYNKLAIEKGLYAHQKYIPEKYLLACAEQRLELLRGLMDGDGSCQPRHKAEYSSTSRRLANDVAELVRSLGGTAKVTQTKRQYKNRPGYIVSLWLPVSPFGLSRKTDKYNPAHDGFKAVSGVEVLDYEEPMKCIKVDAEDSLYVTRSYTLTHNTGRAKSFFTTLLATRSYSCGFKPMIVSLEMSGEKVRDRVYTIMASGAVSNTRLSNGEVDASALDSLRKDMSERGGFMVVTNNGAAPLTPSMVEAKIDQHHPAFVIIDYAQLASDNAQSDNMRDRMLNQSVQYKQLAMRKQVVIILISSATAESVAAIDTPPLVEQVAWSKQLAYDADLALAIHKYEDSNLVAVVCRKNRNGPMFAGYLDWDIDRGIISEKFSKD